MVIIPAFLDGEKVKCGYLIIPENRQDSSSRDIKVFFARVATYEGVAIAKPIVYLARRAG